MPGVGETGQKQRKVPKLVCTVYLRWLHMINIQKTDNNCIGTETKVWREKLIWEQMVRLRAYSGLEWEQEFHMESHTARNNAIL